MSTEYIFVRIIVGPKTVAICPAAFHVMPFLGNCSPTVVYCDKLSAMPSKLMMYYK